MKKELQAAIEAKRSEAGVLWGDFTSLRDAAKNEGVDLTKVDESSDAFKKLEDAHLKYGKVKEEVSELERRLVSVLDMEAERKGDESFSSKRDREEHPGERMKAGVLEGAKAFLESDDYKSLQETLAKQSRDAQVGQLFDPVEIIAREAFKTLVTGSSSTSGGALFPNDRIPGLYVDLPRRARVIAQLFTQSTTDVDAVDYVEQTSRTNNAAETAEAVDADKAAGAASSTAPESAFALVVRTVNVREITHFIPSTKRALADAGQLQGLIDSELTDGVLERIDGQLMNGGGTGEDLEGVLNKSGIQTQALGADSRADAIHKAITKILLAFYDADAIVLHPTDWESIRLEKNVNGDYYYGPPNMAGDRTIWGYPIVLSTAIAQGTALAGAFRVGGTIWNREGVSLSATDSHSDWFTKRIVAVMATARLAFAAKRPTAFCTVTGL